MDAGADVNHEAVGQSNSITALMTAAISGHKDIVEVLVAAGALVNLQSKGEYEPAKGATALHLAAYHGHTDVVNALIARGATVDLQKGDNSTAHSLALQNGHKEVVNALLAAGATASRGTKPQASLSQITKESRQCAVQ